VATSPPVTPAARPPAPGVPPKRVGRPRGRWVARVLIVLLVLSAVLTVGYGALSVYVATKLADEPPKPLTLTPATYGLSYREVTFPSRVARPADTAGRQGS
jgi:hypothetical protein